MKDKFFIESYFKGKQESRGDIILFFGIAFMVVFFLAAIIR